MSYRFETREEVMAELQKAMDRLHPISAEQRARGYRRMMLVTEEGSNWHVTFISRDENGHESTVNTSRPKKVITERTGGECEG